MSLYRQVVAKTKYQILGNDVDRIVFRIFLFSTGNHRCIATMRSYPKLGRYVIIIVCNTSRNHNKHQLCVAGLRSRRLLYIAEGFFRLCFISFTKRYIFFFL